MYQPPFVERTDAWSPNGLVSSAIVAPGSSIPKPEYVAISGCLAWSAGAMIAVRWTANRWNAPFGAGKVTTVGCSRAARVRSHGVLASACRIEPRSSRYGLTLVRNLSVGSDGACAIARLSVVWCQNVFVACTSLSARRLPPAPAGSTTAIAAPTTSKAARAAVNREWRRPGLRPSLDACIPTSPLYRSRPGYRIRSCEDPILRREWVRSQGRAALLLASWPVSATAATAPRADSQRRIHPGWVYGTATVLLVVAMVLAFFDVGEKAGRLGDWQAFALGVTQGLTELLPISSSGHLILVPWVANWHYLEVHPDFNKTFDVALHLGTLVAVVG